MKINVRSLLMLVSSAAALLMVSSCAQQPMQAQETVQVPVAAVGGGDGSRKVEALVRQPSAGSGQTKYPAVILLHSSRGDGRTLMRACKSTQKPCPAQVM